MKRRPKNTNPKARKPKSRYQKIECPDCNREISAASLKAHYAISHPESLGKINANV